MMIRMRVDFFEQKPDERGNMGEVNRFNVIEVTVGPGEADKLVNVLQEILRARISTGEGWAETNKSPSPSLGK